MAYSHMRHEQLKGSITHLYPYLGPAPSRGMTATKPVLESVARAWKYAGMSKISDYRETHDIGTLNPKIDIISGKYAREATISAAKKFASKPGMRESLGKTFKKWMNWLHRAKASELSKGKSTLSPLSLRNMPANLAFDEMQNCIELTLNRSVPDSFSGWLTAFIELQARDKILFRKMVSKQAIPVSEFETEDDYIDIDAYLEEEIDEMPIERFIRNCFTLTGVLKNGERGQLKPRAIYCPTIIFKLFSKVLEELAEGIGGCLPSNALKTGTVDKHQKINAMFSMLRDSCMIETIDNTKFNETQAVNLYADLVRTLAKMSLLPPDSFRSIEVFLRLIVGAYRSKRVICSRGLGIHNSDSKTMSVSPEWLKGKRTEFEDVLSDYDITDNTIGCPPGMMMGMLNAMSTLMALIPASDIPGLYLLQSSDDAVAGVDSTKTGRKEYLEDCAKRLFKHKISNKFFGQHVSLDKGYAIEGKGWCEYNSLWFVDGYRGNTNSDIPTLVPAGKNPVTDLRQMLRTSVDIINKGNAHLVTVPLILSAIDRSYRVGYHAFLDQPTGEPWMKGSLLNRFTRTETNCAPWHGGKLYNSPTSLNLDPFCLARKLGDMPDEYWYRSNNPRNPTNFSSERTTVKFDQSHSVLMESDLTSCVMATKWEGNRTALCSDEGRQKILPVRRKRAMIEGVFKVYPTLKVFKQNSGVSVGELVKGLMLAELDIELDRQPDAELSHLRRLLANISGE